jgi:alpha-amylase/alpha-mannosidase (GH57 family)
MNGRVALLFGVHAHQPIGNFPEVLERAHERCYRPFLRTLHDYPGFRFAAHFSGPLLDHLCTHHPADMKLLADMAARGQVELFGGGDTEPVLPAIPERDRIGQIENLSTRLARRFGQRPQGAWLTERVWQGAAVPALVRCGIEYVTVDDYHFLCTGRRAEELCGYFTTEEGGRRLDLFPISEALRYRIPFAIAEDAVAFLDGLAVQGANTAAVYFDDIEKFGIWPDTFEWVYEKGWLRRFIEAVLASPGIEVTTYGEFHARQRTRGIVYLPTTSYIEMNEWTLPAPAAEVYRHLVQASQQAGRYDTDKPFLRGGIWRNFLSRYPESNWMHKRMLALSARLADLPERGNDPALRSLLYAAQANDAYWHGLFGGLYLPHLRRGVWRNLLALERALDTEQPRPAAARADLDYDGIDELFLRNGNLQAVIKLDGRAAVCEFDAYRFPQNFADTLRRHAEHYHVRVLQASAAEPGRNGIASAHERARLKHPIEASELVPDPEPQDIFRDSWCGVEGAAQRIDGYVLDRYSADAAEAGFSAAIGTLRMEKHIAAEHDSLTVRYRIAEATQGELRTALSIAMPSCDGFGGRYLLGGEILGGFGQPFEAFEAAEFVLDDRYMKGGIRVAMDPPARVAGRPYHTVSQSEDGFERIMQCVSIEIIWSFGRNQTQCGLTLSAEPDAESTPDPPVAEAISESPRGSGDGAATGNT